ncbi:MAG TPA: hypothetical protein VJZ27_14300 [Aggregatilineales bacterium]|nr:hypothetical protein [Aggregatilineales bacterium]
MRQSHERAADVLFIREKYAELAAAAWQGYQESGRGFLLITAGRKNFFPNSKDILNMTGSIAAGTLNAVYVPATAVDKSGADYPTDSTAEMVETYDADWEIVLVIERMDGTGWGDYRYVGPLKPELAYEQLKNQLPTS